MSALNRLDLMIGDQKSELSQFSESLSPSPNNCRKYQKDVIYYKINKIV